MVNYIENQPNGYVERVLTDYFIPYEGIKTL
jgi:hypothetical protein